MKKITKQLLIDLEVLYGGFVKEIPHKKVSPLDKRSERLLSSTSMQGGDRMSPNHHNYSPVYEKYLQKFNTEDDLTIVEIGILRGTGLAMWSTAFPNSKVIGLDIDPSLAISNLNFLSKKGANVESISIHEFDQLVDFSSDLSDILKGKKIDIIIDDGIHTNEGILNTIDHVLKFLNEDFVYFIEDNSPVFSSVKEKLPNFNVNSYGRMTVVSNKD